MRNISKKQQQVIIKSIKPKYVKPILAKTKKYEFMKVIFAKRDIEEVIIYSSSPEKKFVAYFTLGRIFNNTPKKLWDFFGDSSGTTKEDFFKYFANHEMGYAVEITNLTEFKNKYSPRQIFEDFHAPQSFCYADRDLFLLKNINWEEAKKMEFNTLTDSESNAMVFLYHLLDRGSQHYSKFNRIEGVNKVIGKIIKIQRRIRDQKYDMTDIENLRDICSSFKFWDGHHYFLYLTLTVIDFLNVKLKPECKSCGKPLTPKKKEDPEYFEQYCIGCIENQLMEYINGVKEGK